MIVAELMQRNGKRADWEAETDDGIARQSLLVRRGRNVRKSKILVIYGSTYRQTARVADRIAEVLRYAGHGVDVYQGDQLPDSVFLAEYDCFLLAAPVVRGRHQKCIRQFAHWHAGLLNHARSAFVSVCAEAASDPRRADRYIKALCRETGWYPEIARSFPGAQDDTRDRWLSRWYLKHISRRAGLRTDTSRVWEFTDWNEVERFARSLASAWAQKLSLTTGDADRRSGRATVGA
jgi:menaquinone-dependent protoporphyrinogen oxidase